MIANIRLGMENSLHTRDKMSEVINRLNHRGTKNLSPSHALTKIDSLNSSNIKKLMSNSKNEDKRDTERRRQEQESKSLLGKEWYRQVHEKSRKQQKAFLIRHEGLMMRKKISPKPSGTTS